MIRSVGFFSYLQGASALALLALGAGCADGPAYVEPPASPTYVENASVTGGAVATAPDPQVDVDVVEVAQPPVVDIETYPSVEYEGTTVFFVGGQWYRRSPHGWAYFREEPRELARQRAAHESEPRWAQARQAPRPPEPARREATPVAQPQPEQQGEKAGEKKETKKVDEAEQVPAQPRPKARRPTRAAPAPQREPERR